MRELRFASREVERLPYALCTAAGGRYCGRPRPVERAVDGHPRIGAAHQRDGLGTFVECCTPTIRRFATRAHCIRQVNGDQGLTRVHSEGGNGMEWMFGLARVI